MTKVTLNNNTAAPAPGGSATAQALAKATAGATITDARGRSLRLAKPGILAQYRLIEMLGTAAANDTYVQMVLPLLYVGAIDGDTEISMMTKRELEALIQRLDEDGVAAVMKGVAEHFGTPDPEVTKAALKN